MKSKTIRLAPEDEAALQGICTHEAGHEIVAAHFGLKPSVFVSGSGGVVCHERGPLDRNAAVSWAGLIAEDLCGVQACLRPQLPKLSRENLDVWAREAWRLSSSIFSAEDREGIYCDPDKIDAARRAFDILQPRLPWLRERGAMLAEIFRQQFREDQFDLAGAEAMIATFVRDQDQAENTARQHANTDALLAKLEDLPPVLPAQWPATGDDFMRCAVALDGEERGLRLARVYAAELRRRGGHADILNGTFASIREWRSAVSNYRAWLLSRSVVTA